MHLLGHVGLRPRLVALLAAAMVPLAVAVGVFLWIDFRQTMAIAESEVFSSARLAAATESRIFDETRAVLKNLKLAGMLAPSGGVACSNYVAMVKSANPQYNTVGVVDPSGTITCHNSLTKRQILSDPVLIDRMKQADAPEFLVGNFIVGRVSGKPTVITASRFPTAEGKFNGAVFASLNLDRMTQDVEAVSRGGERSVSLLETGSGRVILHYPPITGVPFGSAFAGHPLMGAARTLPAGGAAEVRGIDGVDRVYGFAPLPGAGNIMLAVGESRERVVAPVYRRTLLSSAGFLTLLLAATSFVWWLSERTQLRPVRRLIATSERIGSGDFEATVDLEPWQAPEFRQLGRVLDAMSLKLADGRKAEEVVVASEARFRILAENTADLITCSNADGERIYVSPASREILGFEPEELMNLRPRDLSHPDDLPIVDAMMEELSRGRYVTGVQYRVAHRDGSYRWAEIAGKPLGDGAGAVFVMRDITSRKLVESKLAEASRRLEQLASTDALTGLANRRAMDAQLDIEFARAARDGSDLSFLLIDVDNFKAFNDTYGHQAGDECLRRIAAALQASLRRPGDVTARYGGEEMAAIMPSTGPAGALERAEEVRRVVEDLALPHSGSGSDVVTVSVGVSTLREGTGLSDVTKLILAADRALYFAKAGGRNKVVQAASLTDEGHG